MQLIILVGFLFLFLVLYSSKVTEKFTIQKLAPLYLPNIDRTIYCRKDKQLPYCKSWANSKANMKCFLNKHLQRKCYWSCKYDKH